MRGLAIYTALRLALLAAVWLVVQLVTPWRGLLAIAIAVAVSGVIGFFVLDRTRDDASTAVWRVFRRIDDRIKRNEMLEDALVEASHSPDALGSGVSLDTEAGRPEVLSAGRQSQADAEEDSVDAGEQPGEGQHGNEVAAGDAIDNDETGANSQR
jgi:hypothetical protein